MGVLSAGQADHYTITLLDHVIIFDGASNLAPEALAEFVEVAFFLRRVAAIQLVPGSGIGLGGPARRGVAPGRNAKLGMAAGLRGIRVDRSLDVFRWARNFHPGDFIP